MNSSLDISNVAAIRKSDCYVYPANCPFDPPEVYPELESSGVDPTNTVFAMVRSTFVDLGMDATNIGTSLWNPFGEFIHPGMNVFIKPNTVVHEHEKGKDLFSVIVHPSIIRPVLDYVCKALDGKGSIVIGDCQLYSSDYDKMMKNSGLGELLEWYMKKTNVKLSWFDLRLNKAKRTWLYGRWARKKIEHDPMGYQFVNLGERSRFKGIDSSRLRIAIASYKNMYKHHCNGRHEYLFPRSFLQSDAVINIAKLKTHRRTAVTLAMKNYMGIPAYKDSLPHFTLGSQEEGGDQYIYPSVRKRICTFLHDQVQSSCFIPVKFICAVVKKLLWNSHYLLPFKDNVYEAMWWGNDTLWRTLGDLNEIVEFSDKNGIIQDESQRSQFVLIDGIIGGEGDGPLACDPVQSGVVFAGTSPCVVDAVAATYMGFDVEKIPLIRNAFRAAQCACPLFNGKLEDIKVYVDGMNEIYDKFRMRKYVSFQPHPQWVGHILTDD
ncbi:MAG TPA: DUF362 domain-containing protein [Chitinispirillaceae bacterium]|nr:DUF362 domain-containing protein [Chitinispirillaceae bacterium]